MNNPTIELVDRGRGLQLSTSRITVQDLVPYFQDGCSADEIMQSIPVLTREEIAVVENYYRAHKDALDAEDERIRERTEQRIREQQSRLPGFNGADEERMVRLQHLLAQLRHHRNGEGSSS